MSAAAVGELCVRTTRAIRLARYRRLARACAIEPPTEHLDRVDTPPSCLTAFASASAELYWLARAEGYDP
jgi:hypothetical protein